MPIPGDTSSLDALYTQAAEATRTGSRSFFFTTSEQGRDDLDRWAAPATAGLRGRLARHPVLDVFLDALDQRAIPHDYPLALIEGVRSDLDQPRYMNFSQLRGLAYRLGSEVSLMLTHVGGFRDPAPALLRDTGERLARGRIYVVLEEMESHAYTEADLKQHTQRRVSKSDAFQAARVQGYYQKAEPGLALLDARCRFAVKVAFDLYRKTLRHIETSNFDSFNRRADVPAVERAWLTARSMAGLITRRLWRVMSA